MFRILLYFFVNISIVTAQNRLVIDSLTHALKTEKRDTSRINIYNLLAWEYHNSDITLTDSFASLAITSGEKEKFCKGSGNGYLNKSFVYRNAGNYPAALQSCRWALVQFLKCGYKLGYASAYNNIASIHYLMSNHSIAQFYYYQSLKIAESLGDEKGAARTLNNIGVVFMEQRQYDKALIYFNKAYTILKSQKDDQGMADCLNNIGSIYQFKKDTKQAVESYQKCAEINAIVGDKKDESSAIHNIGLVYYDQHDFKNALTYFHLSLRLDEQLGDIPSIILTYNSIANCYIKLSMFHAAFKYANEALQLANGFNMKTEIMNAYELLYKIEQQKGNFKKALSFHKLYKIYSDSIYNIETTDKVAELEAQYIKEKHEKQFLLDTKEQEINLIHTQEKEHAVTQYIFIIGLVLIIFVSLIYIVFFLIRKVKSA